jgi:hypothetical protein
MENASFNTNAVTIKYNILDKMYNKLIKEKSMVVDEEGEERLETYELIMYELKREGNQKVYDEIKYRITDGENPNEVFYDIIHRGDYSSGLIWLLNKRIYEYIEEDTYSRFYK